MKEMRIRQLVPSVLCVVLTLSAIHIDVWPMSPRGEGTCVFNWTLYVTCRDVETSADAGGRVIACGPTGNTVVPGEVTVRTSSENESSGDYLPMMIGVALLILAFYLGARAAKRVRRLVEEFDEGVEQYKGELWLPCQRNGRGSISSLKGSGQPFLVCPSSRVAWPSMRAEGLTSPGAGLPG